MKRYLDEKILFTVIAVSGSCIFAIVIALAFTNMNKLRIDVLEAAIKLRELEKKFNESADQNQAIEEYAVTYNKRKDQLIAKLKDGDVPSLIVTACEKLDFETLRTYGRFIFYQPLLNDFDMFGMVQYTTLNHFLEKNVDIEKVKTYFFSLTQFKEFKDKYLKDTVEFAKKQAEQLDKEEKLAKALNYIRNEKPKN
ncbi:hypothetical protein BDAP_001015 [Binucleata daphniae]